MKTPVRPLALLRGARARVLAVAWACLVLSTADFQAQETTPEPARKARAEARLRARAMVLDTAHALAAAENGTRRSGPWEAWLGPMGETVVPVHLFRGNTYHLVLGASGEGGDGGGILADLFDSSGSRVALEKVAGQGRIVLSLAPAASGTYFLRLRASSDQAGCAVSLTYVYH